VKVVINTCFGGFCLSDKAVRRYWELRGKKPDKDWWRGDLERNDSVLVQVVEELGENACGEFAQLKVVEIPDGVDYEINEFGGKEHIAEKHRTWD